MIKDISNPFYTGRIRVPKVLPGYGLSLGITLTGISIMLVIPLGMLIFRGISINWHEFSDAAFSERALASYKLTFFTALAAALGNLLIGFLVAWTLTRYNFFGKRFLDGIVDLPFALPTAVAGIALTTLYSQNGWLGAPLHQLGVKIAFTPSGIILAMLFVGLPFVVRAVQPVLEDLDPTLEEAAQSLGAGRVSTFFRVILPMLTPALLTGFSLALARAIGEYGSVIFIAGNIPFKTELTSLLIIAQLEEFDYNGATAIALLMLSASFTILMALNILQRKTRIEKAEK